MTATRNDRHTGQSLRLVPCRWAAAAQFVNTWHRHHHAPAGYKYAIGLTTGATATAGQGCDDGGIGQDGELVGVAIVGRPVSRHLDDGQTLEVTRTAVKPGVRNGNSMLYGAAWRAARALGYRRLLTYTQDGETGASLRAVGWRPVAQLPPGPGWDRPSRRRAPTGTDPCRPYPLGGLRMTSAPAPDGAVPYWQRDEVTLHHGHVLDVLPRLAADSVHCVVTSPPYYALRDYDQPGQIGQEPTLAGYIEHLRAVFDQLRRVLRPDGTAWLNLGDSYVANSDGYARHDLLRPHQPERRLRDRDATLAPKNLRGVPWRVALALQADGWWLRSAIVWSKPNPMPESVRDRLTCSHEMLFLLTRSARYYFDLEAIREPVKYPDAQTDGRHRIGGTGQRAHRSGHPATARRAAGNPYRPPRQTDPPEPAGDPRATPPGNRPQTNFGATGRRNGRSHPLGKNPGDVWRIPTACYRGAHFAVMPAELARRAIRAGSPPGGLVLDPFAGSGTTLLVAAQEARRATGIDLSTAYLDLAIDRLTRPTPLRGRRTPNTGAAA